ncbi:MAG: CARDB domain-containing protein [Planctomycetota bacterium JB042]
MKLSSLFARSWALAMVASLGACVCFGDREAPPPEKPAPVMEDPCDLLYPTGVHRSSVLCLNKDAPAEVVAGESFEYQISVENITTDPIAGVHVVDKMPPGFDMEASTPTGTPIGGGAVRFDLGTISPGQTKSSVIRGRATGTGKLTNCAMLEIDNEYCVPTNVVNPSLKLEKSAPAQVLACDMIPISITVTNDGQGTARNVVITDSLPDGLTANGQSSLSWDVGDLASGQSKTVTANAKASRTGSFSNTANATAEPGIMTSSNTTTTNVVKPALSLTMSCPGLRYNNQNIEFQVAVSNNGNASCEGTVVEATIPAGTSFVSASDGGSGAGNKVQWMVGSVAAGGSKSMSFTVRPNSLGTKTSNATATCACSDPADAMCTTEVKGIPAVLLEVIDVEDPRPVGENETYVIKVTNQGSVEDTNIRIVAELESQMEYVSSSGATTGTHSGGTVTFAPLPSLGAKASAEWRVVVKAVGAGDVRFKVIMNTDELDRPVEETEATNFYD